MLKNRRVLITGATGFIGANLVRKCLDAGAKVCILTRSASEKWRIEDILGEVQECVADLLDYDRLKKVVSKIKPEIVFHTATYGGYFFQKQADRIILTNIVGTTNLANACSKVGYEVFVNTGSSSEYALKDAPIKEDDLLNRNSYYGIAKAASTLFCQLKAIEEDLPITTLRLFSPYGYYEEPSRLIPSVVISCLKGRDPRLSSPSSVRDFIFVEDTVDAYLKVVAYPDKARSKVFNIGSGCQHSVGELVTTIIKITGSKVEPQWGASPNSRIEPKMWQADIDRASHILDWHPRYDLEDGLKKTVEWFEKNLNLYENRERL